MPEALDRGGDDLVGRVLGCDVADERRGVDCVGRLVQPVGATSDDEDLPSRLDQERCNGSPDSGRAAGDDRDLSLEALHHASSRSIGATRSLAATSARELS